MSNRLRRLGEVLDHAGLGTCEEIAANKFGEVAEDVTPAQSPRLLVEGDHMATDVEAACLPVVGLAGDLVFHDDGQLVGVVSDRAEHLATLARGNLPPVSRALAQRDKDEIARSPSGSSTVAGTMSRRWTRQSTAGSSWSTRAGRRSSG